MQPTSTPNFELIYENLREAMGFFGRASGRGEIRAVHQAIAIYSGIEYGVFNIGLLDSMPEDAGASIDACATYFKKHSRRWSMWLCEDAVAPGGRRVLQAALDRHHLREISRAPGMIAEKFREPRRELPVIQCVPVETQKQRETFGGMAAVCFDLPMGVTREVYYPEHGWKGSYRGYLGLVAGRPVGIIALVQTGKSLGVYSLGINPESRGLGYGEALLRLAVEQARSAGPRVDQVVLQSSDIATSLYKHMGFREVTQLKVYLTK